jgi:hypothetical protein
VAIRVPSSKNCISLASVCTSTIRFRVARCSNLSTERNEASGNAPRCGLLRRKGFVDHALRGGVQPRISDRMEPMLQLGVEIVEIAERAGEEEVLADIPVRPHRPCLWSWPGKDGRPLGWKP